MNQLDTNAQVMMMTNVHHHIKQDLRLEVWRVLELLNSSQGWQKVAFSCSTAIGLVGHIFGLIYKHEFLKISTFSPSSLAPFRASQVLFSQ